jgi:hypothetical protein
MDTVSTKHNTLNNGFFSNCSLRLFEIVRYINTFKKLPTHVNSSTQFNMYKPNTDQDVTFDYFQHYHQITDHSDIITKRHINFHFSQQFTDYSTLDFHGVSPLVRKYFSPSNEITTVVQQIKHTYKIDCTNCIGVYFRGTDKKKETLIASYETFYQQIKGIMDSDPSLQIIVQTDTAQFLEYIKQKPFKNIIVIHENLVSYTDHGVHFERTRQQNHHDMYHLFATFLILSKCKYFVCSSGNCSFWIMLYRGHAINVFQFLESSRRFSLW